MEKRKTYHETNEELESGSLELRHEGGAIPENESNDEEDQGLGEGVKGVAPNGGLV